MTDKEATARGVRRSFGSRVIALVLQLYLSIHLASLWLLSRIRRTRKVKNDSVSILLTGTFYSENWVSSHILPLANAQNCQSVKIVSLQPMKSGGNIEFVCPPTWLRKCFGGVGARLIYFASVAIRTKPDIVGGFHLLFNGLAATLVAKLSGAASLYFCVGGPAEVQDGGLMSENRLFEKIEVPNKRLEKKLLRAVNYCDLIVTMGTSAKKFFEAHGIRSRIDVVSGGIVLPPPDSGNAADKSYDLVFVGRLVPIKRLDLFLRMVAELKRERPGVSAVIVGDGPLRSALERNLPELGIEQNVTFAGFDANVGKWLEVSSLFVLTSDSEGLSLALMEAMSYGLPAIVSDVGDLGDLVRSGHNGYLVQSRDGKAFAAAANRLLSDPDKLRAAGVAARKSASEHELEKCTHSWIGILADVPWQGRS